MVTAVSSTSSCGLAYQVFCDGVSDICKTVHHLAMKIINAIKECFNPSQNAPTTIAITAMSPNPRNIVPFYYGLEANNNHVTLSQILNWNNEQLETVHNYIQWLFPLETPSGPNPTAPVLDQGAIQAFRNDPLLRNQLLLSFHRMLAFYGLQMDRMTRMITRASNFNARAGVWLTPDNHNFLRITRIIRSLGLLGLPEYGRAFSNIMEDIAQNEGSGTISNPVLGYWRAAVL